jgi:hypothetical protein
MITYSKLGAIVAASIVASSVFAQTVDVSQRGYIQTMAVGYSEGVKIYLTTDFVNPNCTPPGGVQNTAYLRYSHGRYKDIYAALLSAQMSGQTVTLRTTYSDQVTKECEVMYIWTN